MAELEVAVAVKKQTKAEIEKEFEKQENISSPEKMKNLNADYQKVCKALDSLEVEYENVFVELMDGQ